MAEILNDRKVAPAPVDGSPLGRRYADRSTGFTEELSPKGRTRRAARAEPQQRARPHGERRSNDTYASTTDPDARLQRKSSGQEAKLCFMGHAR
jgi:hypothetical protein